MYFALPKSQTVYIENWAEILVEESIGDDWQDDIIGIFPRPRGD